MSGGWASCLEAPPSPPWAPFVAGLRLEGLKYSILPESQCHLLQFELPTVIHSLGTNDPPSDVSQMSCKAMQ